MNIITETLKHYGVFYLATIDDDCPRVRPFSSVTEYDGETYLCTNNQKKCYSQLMKNPKVEICTTPKEGTWVRIDATLVRDERDEVKKAMLADPTGPSNIYTVEDEIFEVLKITEATAIRYSFTDKPLILK